MASEHDRTEQTTPPADPALDPQTEPASQTEPSSQTEPAPPAEPIPPAEPALQAEASGTQPAEADLAALGEKARALKSSRKAKKKKKKKRISVSTIILLVILLAGVGVLSYPTVSDWWNSMHASRAIAGYAEAVEDLSAEEREQMLQAAKDYNASLAPGVHFNITDAELATYNELLDITGTGIMGYVTIPSIDVELPVYHTTDEAVLQIAIGHIPGSSLPVGGETCHTVLSGHRGLPSARLLTDLDKLVVGDLFTITTLDQTITYMVDQIRIVLPEQTEDLAIETGEDYCTLVTCTPYGVNSHRMLVRGTRIANILEEMPITAEATRIPNYIVVPAVGVPLLFIVLAIMLLYYRKRTPKMTKQELLEELKRPQAPEAPAQEPESGPEQGSPEEPTEKP